MNTHEIALGGNRQQTVTFEVADGLSIMKRLLTDFQLSGAEIANCDEYGFTAALNGHRVAYTMTELGMDMESVLRNHFNGEKTKFFHQSDAHKNIEGDTYIRYAYNGIAAQIWVGGDNGEVCVLNSATPWLVDRLLTIIQFNK